MSNFNWKKYRHETDVNTIPGVIKMRKQLIVDSAMTNRAASAVRQKQAVAAALSNQLGVQQAQIQALIGATHNQALRDALTQARLDNFNDVASIVAKFVPYSFKNQNGLYSGLAIDDINLVDELTNRQVRGHNDMNDFMSGRLDKIRLLTHSGEIIDLKRNKRILTDPGHIPPVRRNGRNTDVSLINLLNNPLRVLARDTRLRGLTPANSGNTTPIHIIPPTPPSPTRPGALGLFDKVSSILTPPRSSVSSLGGPPPPPRSSARNETDLQRDAALTSANQEIKSGYEIVYKSKSKPYLGYKLVTSNGAEYVKETSNSSLENTLERAKQLGYGKKKN